MIHPIIMVHKWHVTHVLLDMTWVDIMAQAKESNIIFIKYIPLQIPNLAFYKDTLQDPSLVSLHSTRGNIHPIWKALIKIDM